MKRLDRMYDEKSGLDSHFNGDNHLNGNNLNGNNQLNNNNGNYGNNGNPISPSGTYMSDKTTSPSLANLETVLAKDPATTALYQELFPQDSWTPEGVYWADLKGSEKRRFINAAQGAESHKEWSGIMADFRKDPLLPLQNYFRVYVLPGMGLFTEGNNV